MKKLILIAGVLIVSLSAEASSEVTPFSAAGAESESFVNPAPADRLLPPCANFTGTWAGTCNSNGVLTSHSATILQSDCSSIGVDGYYVAIPGSSTATRVYPRYDGNLRVTSVAHLTWDSTRSILLSRTQTSTFKDGYGYIHSDLIDSSMYLQNGKLASYTVGSTFASYCELVRY